MLGNSNDKSSGSLSTVIFMLILAVVVLMVFVGSSHHGMGSSRRNDEVITSTSGQNTVPAVPDYGAAPSAVSRRKNTDNRGQNANHVGNPPWKPRHETPQQAVVATDEGEMDLLDGSCKGNEAVTAVTGRFWETFEDMRNRLAEYGRRAFNAQFSHVVSNDTVDLFVKMNVSTWLNWTTGVPSAEVRNLYKQPMVKNTAGGCGQDAVYRAIFLYNVYEVEERSFYDLIRDNTLLSNLPDGLTKSWVEVMRSTCRQTADMTASQEKVSHFVRSIHSNIALELANQMYLNHAHRMVKTQPATHDFTDKRITCLLRTFLRYWQYEAVKDRHEQCCQNTFNTYSESLTRNIFLVVQDALTNEELKSVHPHLWMILTYLIQRFPGIVLSGTKADSALSLIDVMSTNMAALNTSLQYGTEHYNDSQTGQNPLYYCGKEVSDIFFGRRVITSRAESAALCALLSDNGIRMVPDTLQTHITLNSAVISFVKKHAIRLGLSRVFIWKRKAVVADNIAYYKFLDRMGNGENQGDVLYTLNTLDKPLPALRSRFGETHGMLALFIGGIGVTVLATGKCRAFYLKSHRAIIARQNFTKMINSHVPPRPERVAHFRVGTSIRPIVNINAVSALIGDKSPVLKSTLIMSLTNTYEPDVNTFDENKYLFIRANTLNVFSAAFPPSMSVLHDVTGFIDKLKTLTQTGRSAFAGWSRVYAMGESLLVRACNFLSDRWNAMAKENAAYIPVRGDKEKLILLWQFLRLRSFKALYSEFNLIFGSLLYCEDKDLSQKSHSRVTELLIGWRLVMIRLTCINFLLNQWQQIAGLYTPKKTRLSTLHAMEKDIMKTFDSRQDGIAELFSRRDINMTNDFYKCYPDDNANLKAFSSEECYRLFDETLISTDNDIAVMQVVPLYGYSRVFPMHSLYVKLDDGTQARIHLYNGSSKFSIPIKNARATCQLIDAATHSSLLKLDVLSTAALFVSLIVSPVNINPGNADEVNTHNYIEYRVKVQISYRMSPLESETKRAIVSFATRPTTTKDDTPFYNSMIDLSADHANLNANLPSSSLFAANRSRRLRIPLSLSPGRDYYEVPSLDELELSVDNHGTDTRVTSTAAGDGQPIDTSLIPLSAAQFLQASLSTPTKLGNQQTGNEGIYFALNGERYALPV